MTKQFERCLVTGGAGFIGCAISTGLLERCDQVLVLDNLHPQIHKDRQRPDALDSRAKLIVGDICDPAVWDLTLQDYKPDLVIHLAAETGTGQSLTQSSRHADVNVVGTTQMLDAFVRSTFTPSRIVFSGSRAVYGEGAWRKTQTGEVYYPGQRSRDQLAAEQWDFEGAEPLPHEADATAPHPTSVYGATKLAQENILSAWSLALGAHLTTLRFQNVYGPGQSLINSYTGIVSLFVRLAREGKSIPLYEDGRMLRDFVLIDDVASAVLAAIDSPPPVGKAYDIGVGVGTSIAEVAQIIAARYKAPAPHITGQYRHGDVRHASANLDHTLRNLKWKPEFTLEQGLEVLCRWIDEQLDRQS